MSNNNMHENKVQTCLALSVKKLETKLVLVRPKVRNILKVEINIEIGTTVPLIQTQF
jgi:hypothetical protein